MSLELIAVAVARSVFLLAFLLAVSIKPRVVRRPAMLLFGHVIFAFSIVVVPSGMLYYQFTWDDPAGNALRLFANITTAHYLSLAAAFVFAVGAVLPFRVQWNLTRIESRP